jgi:hypothetical protein
MKEARLAGGGKRPIAFIANRALCLIDADNGDADWMSASTPELNYLVPQIIDHTINLLDHGLCQDFHFHANLHRGNRTSSHHVTGVGDRRLPRNNLAERSVTAASGNAPASILDIQYAILPGDYCVTQLGRPPNGNQVLE